jgi:4-carboxymuconolactone decarboxylase
METIPMSERETSERFERGLKTRREVLGADYVDRAVSSADDFTWAMQELTTEWCWDGTWNRPGLDRRARSILNLGMLAALGRSHEFKIHVRGALNNGVTREELKEIFLQIGTYCGVPAAMDSFRVANEVFRELNKDSQPK